jgi:hypothetical protein
MPLESGLYQYRYEMPVFSLHRPTQVHTSTGDHSSTVRVFVQMAMSNAEVVFWWAQYGYGSAIN